jgi:hypothetical protein
MAIRRLSRPLTLAVLLTVGGLAASPGPLEAQDPAPELSAPDAMRLNLEQHAGKRVRLRLVSGQEVDGTVVKVGAGAVHLTQLTGMELFDAVVRLDQVAAVVFRRAGR